MKNKLIVALDVDSVLKAKKLEEKLSFWKEEKIFQ